MNTYLKDKISELERDRSGNNTMWMTVWEGCYVRNS